MKNITQIIDVKSIKLLVAISMLMPVQSVLGQQPIAAAIATREYLGVSLNSGFTFTHMDFKWSATVPSPVYSVGLHYYALPYLELLLDLQHGLLKGGSPLYQEKSATGFENKYWALNMSFRFAPVALADNNDNDKVLKALSCIYIGTGIGFLKNKTLSNLMLQSEYGSLQKYNGSDLYIPVELGITMPVAKQRKNQFLLNINLRTMFCFSDEIDGYLPTVNANKYNDAFSSCTAGILYKFGL